MSPLAQGRELKYEPVELLFFEIAVAPRAGAGIEISGLLSAADSFIMSPLAQGRELKYAGGEA